jgi:hypothetical protein
MWSHEFICFYDIKKNKKINFFIERPELFKSFKSFIFLYFSLNESDQ